MVLTSSIMFLVACAAFGVLFALYRDRGKTLRMVAQERDDLRQQIIQSGQTPAPRGMISGITALQQTLAKDEPKLRETVEGLVTNGMWTRDEADAFYSACRLTPPSQLPTADDLCPECGDLYAASDDDYLCPKCRKNVGV